MKSTAILAALGALGMAGSALAQTVPDAIADLPGVTSIGELAGLQAWSAENTQYLWLEGPDGELIAGFVFDRSGTDIGAEAAGVQPTEFAVMTGAVSPEEAAAGVSATLAVKPEDIGIEVPKEAEAETSDEVAKEAPAAIRTNEKGETEIILPSEAFDVAQEMLTDLPEAERAELLMALVTALRPVETEEEFVEALQAWQADVYATIEGMSPASAADDAAATDEQAAPEAEAETPAEPATIEEDAAEAAPSATEDAQVVPASAESDTADAEEFFRETREDTTWFAVGDADAPVVYAYIDPTCPFCARAIDGMRAQVENGELQLRVILAPLVSARAPEVIAGILLHDDPVEGFLEHETSVRKHTTSPIKPRTFEELPAQVSSGIRKNYETVLKNRVPGVPFFAFATESGPQFVSGVPKKGDFDAALTEAN
ncbi:hypothetical protein [Palleronia sp.]|uniref:hypothetical protein n=1 Tax=Palleronia sp. TaxID=1940284 RepID=UPI0035C87118